MKSCKSMFRPIISIAMVILCLTITSCDFLKVDLPRSLVSSETAFNDDEMASAVTIGMYSNLIGTSSFASGGSRSVTALTGLSSDELSNYYSTDADYVELELNALLPDNDNVLSIWTSAYKSIYDANVVIEGLNNSTGVTKATKDQLQGEAFFIRAFSNFYLVNLFGDIPLIKTTDYRENVRASRSNKVEIYNQIIEDLILAETLLSEGYIDQGRLRVNKAVAQAMQARVYLFTNDWQRAEAKASKLIENTATYYLETELNKVFLADSKEAIWQLSLPDNSARPTHEGSYFIVESTGHLNSNRIILQSDFISAFEDNDKRLANWVGSFDTGTGKIYFPFKYKLRAPSSTAPEHSMVFRLAEQYLIRAEARARTNDLAGAIRDLDAIRKRATLPLIADINPSITQEELLLAIEHERKVEFFVEWGHRWLDLIRTNRANIVLGALKVSWNEDDIIYPIPQSELNKNPALEPQNRGY